MAQIPEIHSFWGLDIEITNTQPTIARQYPSIKAKTKRPLSAKQWKDRLIANGHAWIKCPSSLISKKETQVLITRVKEVTTQAYYRPGKTRWLIIEQVGDNEYKYYVSNAFVEIQAEQLVIWAHERWKVEQNYQQLKEELGMDHFEGRSWRGLHHHLVLCFMAVTVKRTHLLI